MKRNTIILMLLLLAGCAHAPQQALPLTGMEGVEGEGISTELPKLELTRQMLYELLLADVAAQRGKADLAAQAYLELAKSTRDPRLARYATHLAFETRQMEEAREASALWQEVEPKSLLAKQMAVTLMLGTGRMEEARPHLVNLLASYPDNVGNAFIQIYAMLARLQDRMATLQFMQDLARPYPRVAEARWVVAQLAEAAGKHDLALEEAHQATALQPEWDKAVLLEAKLLLVKEPLKTLALLKGSLASNPGNNEVRLLYARVLMEQRKFQDARTQFQLLLDAIPDSPDIAFAVALLSLELGELDRAEKELRLALANGKKDEDAVYYYLGQLSEAKRDDGQALHNYINVKNGEYLFSARLRMAYLLNKSGRMEDARSVLHKIDAQGDKQLVQLIMFEAQMLRDAKQQDAAYRLLQQGLEKIPDQPELLYEAAMLADQTGKHDVFEKLIRRLIKIKPDYAHSYNALGYSLLDRNERLEEGMTLVEKAYQLAPDDAAVIDSVGWGHYRLGNLPKSVEFLRRAYAANHDPEIAAHLGEVLWMKGDKDEATRIWQQALKEHPDNAVLATVVKKFLP